jgi:hypothetical protein
MRLGATSAHSSRPWRTDRARVLPGSGPFPIAGSGPDCSAHRASLDHQNEPDGIWKSCPGASKSRRELDRTSGVPPVPGGLHRSGQYRGDEQEIRPGSGRGRFAGYRCFRSCHDHPRCGQRPLEPVLRSTTAHICPAPQRVVTALGYSTGTESQISPCRTGAMQHSGYQLPGAYCRMTFHPGNHPSLLQSVADRRHLGKVARRSAGAGPYGQRRSSA